MGAGGLMLLVLISILLLVFSSLISSFIKDKIMRSMVSCFGTAFGSLAGLLSFVLPIEKFDNVIIFKTNIPSVSFSFGVDALSSFFILVILLISLLISFYGFGYLKNHKHLIDSSPFFPLLVASMLGVVISKDGFSFIIIWEIMSLASFFLVTAEHENKNSQDAGWIYLIATHIATAFLMAFFVIMAKTSGSFLFSSFVMNPIPISFMSGMLFVFVIIGFGTKAGIFPMHVWLPHAHPAAPSYISAIMSGVMIKTGIYGIMRAITFFQTPPVWWGTVLIVTGVVSAVIGVLYALMQHDLKRLLAYHSVENIGIIITGVGAGLVGISKNNQILMLLGFGGALFHVFNHAIFKSVLFLCAGNLLNSVHSLNINRLGGLIKRLPITGIIFIIASISICGLPPLNGFISEWLIYMSMFSVSSSSDGYLIVLSVLGILGIAFAGGLAVICFTKVTGVVFLGEPRAEVADNCVEPPLFMIFPMIILALLCVLFGVLPLIVMSVILPAVYQLAPFAIGINFQNTLFSLSQISIVFIMIVLLSIAFFIIRKLLFRKKQIDEAVTWDCGYIKPKPTMQYTASSFAEPIRTFFKSFLKPEIKMEELKGVFPEETNFEEHVVDCAERNIFSPVFEAVGLSIRYVRRKKKNTIQNYLMLIFITLIILFVLEVWFGI